MDLMVFMSLWVLSEYVGGDFASPFKVFVLKDSNQRRKLNMEAQQLDVGILTK